MTHPSFSHLRRLQRTLLTLALLACSAAGAQHAPPPASTTAAPPATANMPSPAGHMIAEIQVIPRP
ncbi:MAG: hypothetical protein WA086_19130, partial [Ideonella sp.]